MCRLWITACLLSTWLTGCGGGQGAPMREALALHFTFPQELAPASKRYRRWLTSVRFLELLLAPGSGPPVRQLYPPGGWSSFPMVPVPAGAPAR